MLATKTLTTHPAIHLLAAARSENPFERLLSPVGWDAFLNEIWERRPYHFSGRTPDHYADLLSPADLDAIIQVSASSKLEEFVKLVRFGDGAQIVESVPRTAEGMADLRHVYRAYDAGYSIKVDRLQVRWQPVARVCRPLRSV